jgi:hypothetical protein
MPRAKPIEWVEVFYQRNVDLNIDPFCCECTSHLARCAGGYAHVNRDGFHRLHRWVYWRHTGETPEVVMHLCDNPICINFAHLRAGTPAANVHDCVSKGRMVNPPLAVGNRDRRKLTDEQVVELKRFRSEGATTRELAEYFGVHPETIRRIIVKKFYG